MAMPLEQGMPVLANASGLDRPGLVNAHGAGQAWTF